VDLPEPDGPMMETISPFSHFLARPLADENLDLK